MTAPTPPELKDAAKLVPTIVNMWDLAIVSDTLKFDLDAIEDVAAVVIGGIDQLKELTTIRSKMIVPEDQELWLMYKNAIAKIALPLRGGQVFAADTFKSAVEAAVDPTHKEFCVRQSWQAMIGVLREHPEIAELLEQEGILVWVGDELEVDMHTDDNKIRIVNARFLEKKVDIYEFVVAEPLASKRCRFCTALEGPSSFALQPLDQALRNKDVRISGMTGERVQILRSGIVYTHPNCAKYWIAWLEIAERFAQEEAA